MRVSHTGHFERVLLLAELHNATSVSVQNYYCFCNFANTRDASYFLRALPKDMDASDINTERPGTPAEVRIRHPK